MSCPSSQLTQNEVTDALVENERLPLELGWARPDELIDMGDVQDMLNRVIDATDSDVETAAMLRRNGGIHAGL